MAVTTVSFSKQGDNYLSDAIDVAGNAIAVQIKYEKSGGTALERSVDGTDYFPCASILSYGNSTEIFETNVSGLVPGTKLRIRFMPDVIPTQIKVLQ